jgi:hypothetical protein
MMMLLDATAWLLGKPPIAVAIGAAIFPVSDPATPTRPAIFLDAGTRGAGDQAQESFLEL